MPKRKMLSFSPELSARLETQLDRGYAFLSALPEKKKKTGGKKRGGG